MAREQLSVREILAGSVQIYTDKIRSLGLEALPARQEVFWWPHAYDAAFLGYMEGALFLHARFPLEKPLSSERNPAARIGRGPPSNPGVAATIIA
ncbi:MAG: hypothetical protein WDN49_09475 [Acetobacteraceae bacterium]